MGGGGARKGMRNEDIEGKKVKTGRPQNKNKWQKER